MGSVKEIEEAVLRLSAVELAAFRAWFAELDADGGADDGEHADPERDRQHP